MPQFLSTFVRPLNNNDLSEGAALMTWPHFLADDALEAFRTQAKDGEDDLGGFSIWREAVNWFLQTYAKDAYLEEAVAEIHAILEKDGEDERSFARCLTCKERFWAGSSPKRSFSRRSCGAIAHDPTGSPASTG